jgi:spore coat protein A, manganese oxidase
MSWAWAQARGLVGTLNPADIPKYVSPLVIPPVMPQVGSGKDHGIDTYKIGVRQFRQQVLPATLPGTRVWGYGAFPRNSTFNSPAFTIEARVDRPVRVTWINDLVDNPGRIRPHLLPVDPTLHWANPPGGLTGRDSRPTFTSTPGPYTGPVPIVTHLHGGHSREESDGYPEAWFLPDAKDIPAGFARVGSFYDQFAAKFAALHGVQWQPGTATFQYDNDQRPTTEWFHDHVLGMTRLNVYAGLAGFYLLRGGRFDLPTGCSPDRRRPCTTRTTRGTSRSRWPSRTARSTPTGRCSTPTAGPSSTAPPRTSPTAPSRRSGTRSSSATR